MWKSVLELEKQWLQWIDFVVCKWCHLWPVGFTHLCVTGLLVVTDCFLRLCLGDTSFVTTSSPFILLPSDLLFLQPVTPIALRSAEEQQETIPITPLQGAYTSSPHSVTLLNRSAPHSNYHPSQRLQMALPYPGHAHSGYIPPPMPGAVPVLPPHPHMPSRPAPNTSQFYPYPWP